MAVLDVLLQSLGLDSSEIDLPREIDLEPERKRQLLELQARLGYRFSNPFLLDLALTHASQPRGDSATPKAWRDYERLEFLGDAVLGMVIASFLVLGPGCHAEGHLTRARAHLVSRKRLAQLGLGLDLGAYVRMSAGEGKTGGRNKPTIAADTFESVIGAIYLDGGEEAARSFVVRQFQDLLGDLRLSDPDLRDPKTQLQERLHERGLPSPTYRVVREEGPDHQKTFWVEVLLAGQVASVASGPSKKQAEKNAAAQALESFDAVTSDIRLEE